MSYKLILILSLLTSCSAIAGAQSNSCVAKYGDLPAIEELRGFRLGMTPDQVKAQVPQVKFGHKDEFGVAKTSINPYFDPRIDKTNFADVRTISLDFLDDAVSSVWIGFDGTFKWKSAEEFVTGISHELKLPQQWTTKGRTQQLQCADFQLTVGMVAGGPSFRLIDTSADNTITQRRQEKADAGDAAETADTSQPVIGDLNRKIFYPLDCPALNDVTQKNRIPFHNAAEAEKAGYKHVDGCQ